MARVTEKLRIRIDNCTKNPFYVAWVNDMGGWDFWMFQTGQDYGGSVDRSELYEPYFGNLTTATTNTRTLTTTAQQSVICYAENLSTQEVQGLETLIYSPRVYWLYDLTNNYWKEVTPNKSSYSLYSTDGEMFDFSIEFLLPRTNIPSNG